MRHVINVKPVSRYLRPRELDLIINTIVRGNGYYKLSLNSRPLKQLRERLRSAWAKLSLAHHVAIVLSTKYIVVKRLCYYTVIFFMNDLSYVMYLCSESQLAEKCQIYEVDGKRLVRII